jgi:hypothetical protein
VDADSLLGVNQHSVARVEADHGFNLLADALGLGRREIDFVDHGDDFEVVMQRQMGIGERLRFHALLRVHHQQGALAGMLAARDFVGRIHMAGRIDQVQLAHFAVVGAVIQAHRIGL